MKLNKTHVVSVVTAAIVLAVPAAYAVPPDLSAVSTFATDAQAVGQSMFDFIMPVVAGIMILGIAIKLAKRFGNKV